MKRASDKDFTVFHIKIKYISSFSFSVKIFGEEEESSPVLGQAF